MAKEREFNNSDNVTEAGVASVEEVREFLNKHNFDSYQEMVLPHGLKTSDKDMSKRAEAVFKYPVKGKTVLDMGCKYGFFCHEAILRGAIKTTGVEFNKKDAAIAQEIAGLWGRNITILCQDLYAVDNQMRHDVVLFLNVLHHLISPAEAMKKLVRITNELLIVEFSTLFDKQIDMGLISRSLLCKSFLLNLPLAYIGSRPYHRVWYFSKAAFDNLFVKQMGLFKRVEYYKSPKKKGRFLAYCWV